MPGVPISDILHRDTNNFDLLRLLAAAAVIVSHAFVMTHGSTYSEPLETISAFTLGQHAVNVFFVLSGLLVASSLDRSASLLSFARARILRIVPALAVCVLLTVFVLGPLASDLPLADYFGSTATYAYIVKTLTLSTGAASLPGVYETLPEAGMVNLPLWTLKYEVLSYGLLGLLAVLGIWRRGALLALFIAGLFAWNLFVMQGRAVGEHGIADHMARFFTCFFLGAAAYRLRRWIRLTAGGAAAALLALALAQGSGIEQFVSSAAVGYLVLCLAAVPAGWLRRLAGRGDISYGLYIYGWPLAQLVVLLAPGIGAAGLAAATLGLAGMMAALSWTVVERPAILLGNRLQAGGSARASAWTALARNRSAFEKRPLDAVQP